MKVAPVVESKCPRVGQGFTQIPDDIFVSRSLNQGPIPRELLQRTINDSPLWTSGEAYIRTILRTHVYHDTPSSPRGGARYPTAISASHSTGKLTDRAMKHIACA